MNFYNQITRRDYLIHFISGTLIFCFSVLFFNPIISLGLVILAGFAKEIIYDGWFRRGTVELEDIIATLLGGFIPFLAVILN